MENLWFSGIFRKYKMETLARKRLTKKKESSLCQLLCLPKKKPLKEYYCSTIKQFTESSYFPGKLQKKLKQSNFVNCVCFKKIQF